MPLETLRNLRELTLECHVEGSPTLPTAWGRLPHLTNLSVALWAHHAHQTPDFRGRWSHLRTLKVTVDWEDYRHEGLEYFRSTLVCLPRLTRFEIRVHDLGATGLTVEQAVSRLADICWTAEWHVPPVSSSPLNVDRNGHCASADLVFTIPEMSDDKDSTEEEF